MINRFERFVLKRLLRQPCHDRITKGSEEEKRVRCYTVRLISEANEYLLYIEEVNDKGFSGKYWNDQEQKNYPASVPFNLMGKVSFKIGRFIGSWPFTYPSILRCVLHDWTYRNRLPIIRDAIDQFFYNRRDIALKDRTELLRSLIKKYRENPDIIFYEHNLMIVIHGKRWHRHPDFDLDELRYHGRPIPHYTRVILDSLQESGEIQKVKKGNFFAYKLTGKALATLETYEREAIRHEQMLSQSRHMKWLTFVLMVIGIIQAFVSYFN